MYLTFIIVLLVFVVGPAQSIPIPKPFQDSTPELEEQYENKTETLDVFTRLISGNKNFNIPVHDGDIIINRAGRSAIKDAGCFWPKSANGTVIVPYSLSPKYTTDQVDLFKNAMQEIESVTCVRFVNHTTEVSYLNIVETGGCASNVGRIGGTQNIYLNSKSCMSRGTIQHELEHSLGFQHEHSRSDRDNYVTIMTEYISPENLGGFAKMDTNNLNMEYDYYSVMHYPTYAFSNTSGKNTIIPKPDPSKPIGQRDGLSTLDVSKINALYKCDVCSMLLSNVTGTVTSANYPNSYPNNSNCVWLIRVPSGQVVLKFDFLDVESSIGCSADYIRIYDGPSKTSPVLLDKTCGMPLILPMTSLSNQVLIEFVSNQNGSGRGFNITYKSVQCGGEFYAPAKNFTSPGYPTGYSPNLNCTWIISAPPQYKISLTINDFELEPMFYWMCRSDSLSIYNGPDAASPLIGQFCGIEYPRSITSSGNSMVLQFLTDFSIQYEGFKASYKFVPKSFSSPDELGYGALGFLEKLSLQPYLESSKEIL
ncbi:embryonic protein UVS.2-like [Pelobates fuscus]|uniref:embryonic protein UVS.2-like n=2 Tax=Pelobates fuscus TaxID=191477 RepID=UPI002FE4E0F9